MTDMLMAGDANQATLANIAPGSLVLAYGYSFPGLPGFVIQGEKGVNEVFMMEGPRWGAAALDSRTPVISHGQAIARSAGISRGTGPAIGYPKNGNVTEAESRGICVRPCWSSQRRSNIRSAKTQSPPIRPGQNFRLRCRGRYLRSWSESSQLAS
jgi:hypothetical protein